jgi:hypothetical protein
MCATRNFSLLRFGRRVDVYFSFFLLGFRSRRRIYHRSLTLLLLGVYDCGIAFLLFRGRIDRCLLLLASHEQRNGG